MGLWSNRKAAVLRGQKDGTIAFPDAVGNLNPS